MHILLAIVLGAAVGAIAHLALPHRGTRGAALAPLLGASVGAVVWATATWAGAGVDNPWAWAASIVIPAALTVPVVLLVSTSRARSDDRERARLGIR